MGDDLAGQLKRWQQLKQQAVSGEFHMEQDIGEALRKRCETFLTELGILKNQAQLLDHLSGYGGLPSATTMQTKFEKKAVGGDSHDTNDSAVTRLQQNIEVVQLMQDTYAAAIGKLQATDEAAGNNMNTAAEEMR
jgi:hypothetical protein